MVDKDESIEMGTEMMQCPKKMKRALQKTC